MLERLEQAGLFSICSFMIAVEPNIALALIRPVVPVANCSLLNSLPMDNVTFLILFLLAVLILSVMWSFCYFYGNDISWVVTKHNTKQALTIPAFLNSHGGNSPTLNVCRNGKGDNLKTYIHINDNRGDEGFSNLNEVDRLNLLAKGRAARDEYVSRSEPVVILFDMQKH